MTTRCYEPKNKCRKKLLDQDWHYFTGIAGTLHSRNSHAGKFIYLNARYETENRWRQLVGCNCRNSVTPFTQEKKDCMPSGETEGDTQQMKLGKKDIPNHHKTTDKCTHTYTTDPCKCFVSPQDWVIHWKTVLLHRVIIVIVQKQIALQ